MKLTQKELVSTWTHGALVEVAERWLRGTKKMPVVLTEVSGGWSGGEQPDALGYSRHISAGGPIIGTDLGWYYKPGLPSTNGFPRGCHPLYDEEVVHTIVVEAKASLSDFYSDRQKPFRQDPGDGMGSERYYLCPEGLIDPKRHDLHGWGLLYAVNHGRAYRRPRMVRKSIDFWPKASSRELMMLVKWASVVEMVVGNTPGDVWPSGWKRELRDKIRRSGA